MDPYKDPDEFIKNLGKEAFQERIDQAENSFFFEIRVLQRDFDLKDPEQKTKFHKEIAKKLCGFSVEVERENYLEAIAEKYNIGFENLRKLVNTYALQTGEVGQVARPKSGVTSKATPEENAKKVQRLLLTWITDEPALYSKIAKYISPKDFTEELYKQVAERLFEGIEKGNYNPAAIINMFEDEQQQSEVASLFNAKLEAINTRQEREKAFGDILRAVKQNSLEYYSRNLGSDINALTMVVEGKKALQELQKTHISLD